VTGRTVAPAGVLGQNTSDRDPRTKFHAKKVYWQDEDAWLGYLQVYPD
jgi:hypothetical protein